MVYFVEHKITTYMTHCFVVMPRQLANVHQFAFNKIVLAATCQTKIKPIVGRRIAEVGIADR